MNIEEYQSKSFIENMREILKCNCFPNVSIAIRIYLTFPCSVCEGERSFPKLALIKNEKRATMGQDRLNSLALLSIENEFAANIDFSDIIHRFAVPKVREVPL